MHTALTGVSSQQSLLTLARPLLLTPDLLLLLTAPAARLQLLLPLQLLLDKLAVLLGLLVHLLQLFGVRRGCQAFVTICSCTCFGSQLVWLVLSESAVVKGILGGFMLATYNQLLLIYDSSVFTTGLTAESA